MELLQSIEFWLCVLIVPLILFLSNREHFLQSFSILNLIVLSLLFSYQIVVIAFVVSFCVWVVGFFLLNLNKKFKILLPVAILLPAFVAYKLGKDISMLVPISQYFGGDLISALLALSFSYVVLRIYDYWRNVTEGCDKGDPFLVMGYLFPFYMLVAGPITLYKDFLSHYVEKEERAQFSYILQGVYWISLGLFYKFVIAELVRIYVFGMNQPIIIEVNSDSISVLFYLFFDFAGYSLVALGIGYLCGISTPKNFDKPFLSLSVTEFWTRWHISLGNWVKQNVFFPLQLSLVRRFGVESSGKVIFFTLIFSFCIVGIWHHLMWVFLLWGLFLGVIMALEKWLRDHIFLKWNSRTMNFLWLFIGPIYVISVISSSLLIIKDDIF